MAALVSTLPLLVSRLRAPRAGALRGPAGAALGQLSSAVGKGAGFGGPAQLQLRLDRAPWGQPTPAALDLDAWQATLAALSAWRGPCPVSIVAGDDLDLALGVARFARRLDFINQLQLSGEGIDAEVADALIDLDLNELRVVLEPGASAQAAGAAARLSASKQRRGSGCRIVIALLWAEGAPTQARRLAEAVVSAGLPPLQFEPSARASRVPSAAGWEELVASGLAAPMDPAQRRAVERMFAADDGEPGAPATPGGCPVGALRVELRADGSAWICPFQAPISTSMATQSLREAWATADETRAAVRACGRRCCHPTLGAAPPPPWTGALLDALGAARR